MAIHSLIDFKKMFYASPSAPIQILVQAMTQNYFTLLFTNLNGGQCKHNLLLSIDVGVQYTQNVLKLLRNYKGLWKQHQLMRNWHKNEHFFNFNVKDAVVV